MNANASFYDELSPLYHLIFQDWDASIERQGVQLAALLEREWPNTRNVLDVACGIGTQALALAQQGYHVTASDLSTAAVERARREADKRRLPIKFSTCDMREAHIHHGGEFDVVMCADNSLPHLLSNEELRRALRQMHDCLTPGGGCLVSVRDYDAEPRGRNIVKPYGVRVEASTRYLLFQVWDFDGEYCDISFYFVAESLASGETTTRVMRSKYYAVSTGVILELMASVGFQDVKRVDDAFYQPVLLGSRPA